MTKVLSNVKRTISIGSWPFLLSLLGSIVAASANMCILLLINSIITAITNQALANAFDIQELLNIFILFLLTLPFYFLGMLGSLVGGMCASKNYRQTIMDSATRHHEKHIKDGHSASIMAVMTNDTYKIEDFFYQLLNYGIIHPLVQGIIAIILLFTQSFTLAIFSIFVGLITVSLSIRWSKKVQIADEQVRELMEVSTKTLSELIVNDDMIRMLNIQDEMSDSYYQDNQAYAKKCIEAQSLKDKMASFNNMVTIFSKTIFLALGITLFLKGNLNFGIIFILIPLQASVSQFFSSLSSTYNILVEVSNASQRSFDIIDTEKEDMRQDFQNLDYTNDDPIIQFKNISFGYDDKMLFKNLSLEIERNSTVAFVGESGSGKSTLFQLLLGFYEVDDGSIYIGDKNVYNHNLASIRKQMVYIEQSAPLFNMSIKENIGLGKNGNVLDEEIIEAAKKANIHEFITKLEKGYDTEVTTSLSSLSGGQKQRLAIARAFISDAPIIIMDEPTAALDNESELHIQEALERLRKTRTVLIAAHRLSTIENADKIFVLKDGQIIEEGKHEDLLKNKDYYYSLNQNQSN